MKVSEVEAGHGLEAIDLVEASGVLRAVDEFADRSLIRLGTRVVAVSEVVEWALRRRSVLVLCVG